MRKQLVSRLNFVAVTSCLLLSCLPWAVAEESELAASLKEALAPVATLEPGAETKPAEAAWDIVVQMAKSADTRQQAETLLLEALPKAAGRGMKVLLCKQLFLVASDKSIAPLAKLLGDPEMSDAARYVLGRLNYPAAHAALLEALPKTSGKARLGLIETLGMLRYEPAVDKLVPYLRQPDTTVAAAEALGRIGTAGALTALRSLPNPPASALLLCAEGRLAAGATAEAEALYAGLFADGATGAVRLAGLQGLLKVRGAKALPQLQQALSSTDAKLQASAIELSVGVPGTEVTKALVARLPSLAAEQRALLVGALGRRGDPAATPALVKAADEADAGVRVAALRALGATATGAEVPFLLKKAATAEGAERSAAHYALRVAPAAQVEPALISALSRNEATLRAEAVQALAARKASSAGPTMVKLARDADANVRLAALDALGAVADAELLPALVDLAVNPVSPEERPDVQEALRAVFLRIPDAEKRAAPVLAALKSATAEAKPTLLALLGESGAQSALGVVQQAVTDPDDKVKEAAVRALSDWPDLAAAPYLLRLAQNSTNDLHKVLALRGYVRLAGASDDPAARYAKAFELAKRPEEKKLTLSGLASADTVAALDLAEKYLEDPSVRTEAALAAVKIAGRVRTTDSGRCLAAVRHVLAVVTDENVRRQAGDVLAEATKYEGYILQWLGAGPYRVKGKSGADLLDLALDPELDKPQAEVKWKRVTRGVNQWDINLGAVFGDGDNRVGYLRTRVWSPKTQKVQLELGSDDGLKVFLNGEVVHRNRTDRSCSARQDVVPVELQEGWNDLRLKVYNSGGGWAVACRVRSPEGEAVAGLKTEAKEE